MASMMWCNLGYLHLVDIIKLPHIGKNPQQFCLDVPGRVVKNEAIDDRGLADSTRLQILCRIVSPIVWLYSIAPNSPPDTIYHWAILTS